MIRKIISLALACATVLLCMSQGFAEERAGSFSLSPFAGGYVFDGVQHYQTTVTVGARAGYNITKNIGVEGYFFYVPVEPTNYTPYNVGSSYTPPPDATGGSSIKPAWTNFKNTDAFGAGMDVVYNFMPNSVFVPFVAVGGGWMQIRSNDIPGFQPAPWKPTRVIPRNDDAILDYGAGFKYYITPTIALRGDARQILSFHTQESSHNDIWQNWMYTLGLHFQFGGK